MSIKWITYKTISYVKYDFDHYMGQSVFLQKFVVINVY